MILLRKIKKLSTILVDKIQNFLNDDKRWINYFAQDINKYSGAEYLALTHPEWLGVTSATVELFENVVNVKGAYSKKSILKVSRIISDSDIKQFIINGMPYGWDEIIINVKKTRPDITFKVIWHGSITQFIESENNYCIRLVDLAQQHIITALGFVKYSSYQFYKSIGINCFFIANRVELEQHVIEVKPNSSPRKLGIFIAGLNFRKNVFTQYAAARLVSNAHLTFSPSDPYVKRVINHFGINATLIDKPMPRNELFEIIRNLDLVLYVTFSECAPMLPLECLELGVPCLMGANNHYFQNFPELYNFLVIEEMDNPVKIAEKAEIALVNKQEIIDLYQDFRSYNNKLSRDTVQVFLNYNL